MLLVVLSIAIACCLTACGKKVQGELQIQSLENIVLDEDTKLPYELSYYDSAADAYNEPLPIYVNYDKGEEGRLSFSFTDERFSVSGIGAGTIIERDESYYNNDALLEVGDIQTFSLRIPYVEEVCTVVCSLRFYNEAKEGQWRYIAFRVTPTMK